MIKTIIIGVCLYEIYKSVKPKMQRCLLRVVSIRAAHTAQQ